MYHISSIHLSSFISQWKYQDGKRETKLRFPYGFHNRLFFPLVFSPSHYYHPWYCSKINFAWTSEFIVRIADDLIKLKTNRHRLKHIVHGNLYIFVQLISAYWIDNQLIAQVSYYIYIIIILQILICYCTTFNHSKFSHNFCYVPFFSRLPKSMGQSFTLYR